MSEDDYREKEVKRSTLITLFLNELATDRYITTHLYGAIRDVELDLSQDDGASFRKSLLDLSTSFSRKIETQRHD